MREARTGGYELDEAVFTGLYSQKSANTKTNGVQGRGVD
jgi:hypothetical protein